MKILVSACLLGDNCKYNGGNNYSEKLVEFVKGNEVIKVCPEVRGGLSIPRDPAEIVDGIIMTKAGVSVDHEFREGARKTYEEICQEDIDIAILQSRSPSCGIKEIYDGTFSGKKIKGQGVFAKILIDYGFKVIDIEDL